MRNIQKILLAGALALSSCSVQRGVFENYPIDCREFMSNRIINVYSKENSGFLRFDDYGRDGRIDVIDLSHVKKGDSIEKLASLETGQRLLSYFNKK